MQWKKWIRTKAKHLRVTKSRRSKRSSSLWSKETIGAAVIGVVLALVLGVAMRSNDSNATGTEEGSSRHTAVAQPARPVSTATLAPAIDARVTYEEPTAQATPAAVTITGCLERSDATYRLKDTSGANAPKTRSWKSGFLKKNTATIQIVDPAKRLKLSDHVGQRVSVSGTLADREMKARSLQRVSTSCTSRSRVKA
jgi:cell division protein FtsN